MFLGFLLGSGFTLAGVGGIIVFVFKNRELVKGWLSDIAWVCSRFWKGAEYFAIKNGTEKKINTFANTLNSYMGGNYFPKISLQWAGREDAENILFEENKTFLIMRDRNSKTKNYIHAVYFYTAEMLLKNTKRHLSKTQRNCIDLFSTQKLLGEVSPGAVEQFMRDYFTPELDKNQDLSGIIKKFIHIDKKGVFFPILIQELTLLGHKVFLDKPNADIFAEVSQLIDFLDTFSLRKNRDDTVPTRFVGKYMRCAVRIVASQTTREKGDIHGHKTLIGMCINDGIENVYMLGKGDIRSVRNMHFMYRVSQAVRQEFPSVERRKMIRFPGQIYVEGNAIPVMTFFIHLRNPEAIKHFYEEHNLATPEEWGAA